MIGGCGPAFPINSEVEGNVSFFSRIGMFNKHWSLREIGRPTKHGLMVPACDLDEDPLVRMFCPFESPIPELVVASETYASNNLGILNTIPERFSADGVYETHFGLSPQMKLQCRAELGRKPEVSQSQLEKSVKRTVIRTPSASPTPG